MTRPRITLKLATSLDGKIALANGKSKWITSDASRERGRELRAQHDAIAIGSNTAIMDDPRLTARIKGAKDPIRIIYDSRLRLSETSKLAQSANETPVWIFTRSCSETRCKQLKKLEIRVFQISHADGLDLNESLEVMSKHAVSSLLIEGGGTLAGAFLKTGLVDQIHWFRAPVIIGGDGRNCIGDMNFQALDNLPRYARSSHMMIEQDSYDILERVE